MTRGGEGVSARVATQLPAIIVVEDEPPSLARIKRLLERRFGADYQVVAESTAAVALDRLRELRAADVEVAVILADQSLPEMAGVDFLAQCTDICPEAKRCVLVTFAELEAEREPILRSAALGQIETFLPKPWRDADEAFYHGVTKFLDEWDRTHRPQFEAIRIVGDPWDPYGQAMREALHRSGVPYGFYDADSEKGRRLLEKSGLSGPLPVAIFSDGRVLARPGSNEIASAMGINTDPTARDFDVTVVGSGPAGLAAAVYGASEGLAVLLVENEALGGQASTSTMIRNYLGFPRGLSGQELAGRAFRQAWFFGASFVIGRNAVGLRRDDDMLVLELDDGSVARSRTVVLATGVSYRRLGIPRLEELVGHGVYYGAPVTEATGMAGQHVYVVGGGNSSGQAVTHLARFAAQVTLVVRDPQLGEMSDYLIRELEARRNVDVRLNTIVEDAHGDRRLRSLTVRDTVRQVSEEVKATAVFILIGAEPHTTWLPAELQRDERGYILTGDSIREPFTDGRLPATLETSMAGVFAVGDVRNGSMKRIAAAVGEGSTAIRKVHEYLARLREAG
jgi:thioredoxin reductase (NADPH)